MSNSNPAYISSTGTLTSQPLSVRFTNVIGQYGTIAYLFFETLFSVRKIPFQLPT
jgi:hypothetical protein